VPELDNDRRLALSYIPAAARQAVAALWRLDAALGAVLAGGREPLISQIKLAWWRDSLEKLDRERAPAEPALLDASEHVLPRGVTGAELSRMEEGWAVLLTPEVLTSEELAHYAAARGGLLFRFTAVLLGGEGTPELEATGESWALVDLARHSGNEVDADSAILAARSRCGPRRWPSQLRPLGMLGALAQRDAEEGRPRWEPQGAPKRMLRMMRHRLTGR
jgi:phytoene synthase